MPRLTIRLDDELNEWIRDRGQPTDVVISALRAYRQMVDWPMQLAALFERMDQVPVAVLITQVDTTFGQLVTWLESQVALRHLEWVQPSGADLAQLERGRLEWSIQRGNEWARLISQSGQKTAF